MATNLNAGLQQYGEVTNPTGLAGSITQDPFSSVEVGNNSIKSKYTTTNSSGVDIPDQTPAPENGGGEE